MTNGLYRYSIRVLVPLGIRVGEFLMHLSGSSLAGHIKLLGKEHPFFDGSFAGGEINVCGCLVTLLGEVPYELSGTALPESVRFVMQTKKGIFTASGERVHTNET